MENNHHHLQQPYLHREHQQFQVPPQPQPQPQPQPCCHDIHQYFHPQEFQQQQPYLHQEQQQFQVQQPYLHQEQQQFQLQQLYVHQEQQRFQVQMPYLHQEQQQFQVQQPYLHQEQQQFQLQKPYLHQEQQQFQVQQPYLHQEQQQFQLQQQPCLNQLENELLQEIDQHETSENLLGSYPPGYRFIPTDQELILSYLTKRLGKLPLPLVGIEEVYIYDYTPQELIDKYPCTRWNTLNQWYFISPREFKSRQGSRPTRVLSTGAGYWKPTGNDSKIVNQGKVIGFKKSLEFFQGKTPDGVKTDWKMHEYRVHEKDPAPEKGHQDEYKMDPVLCRIYLNKRIKKQYGNGVAGQSMMNEDDGQEGIFWNEGLLRIENNDLVAINVSSRHYTDNPSTGNVNTTTNTSPYPGGDAIVGNEGGLFKTENNDLVAIKVSSRHYTDYNTSPNPGGDASSSQLLVSHIPNFAVPPLGSTGNITNINISTNLDGDGRSMQLVPDMPISQSDHHFQNFEGYTFDDVCVDEDDQFIIYDILNDVDYVSFWSTWVKPCNGNLGNADLCNSTKEDCPDTSVSAPKDKHA